MGRSCGRSSSRPASAVWTSTGRSQRAAITRDQALERIERRHISTFDLLDPDEVSRGTVLAVNELPPTVEYPVEWLIAVASH